MSTRKGVSRSETQVLSPAKQKNGMLRKSYSLPLSIGEIDSDVSSDHKMLDSLPHFIVRPSKSEEVPVSHKLDRYGFILNMDAHGNVVSDVSNDELHRRRLKQDPSDDGTDTSINAPTKASTTLEPGSPTSLVLFRYPVLLTPTVSDAARTERRVNKWETMLSWNMPLDIGSEHRDTSSWNRIWHRSQRQRRCRMIKRRLRKGVPNQKQRAQVWPVLCHVNERMRDNPGLYRLLVETSVGGVTSAPSSAVTISTTATTSSHTTNMKQSVDHKSNLSIDRTQIEINYTEKIGPSQPSVATTVKRHIKKKVIAFQYSKSFKAIQETIERDLHRTFPRHSLFYTGCEEEDSEDDPTIHSQHDSMMNDDEQSSDTRALQQKGICGTTEISNLMRELDLVPTTPTQSIAADPVEKNMTNNDIAKNDVSTNRSVAIANNISQNGEVMDQAKMFDGVGGQSRLRRVLNAYGTYDREIGYCQGMNFIAAMFLTIVSEEIAFWMLVSVMQDRPCRMRGMFGEGMHETHQSLYVAEKLIQQFLPKLAKHFEKETIHVTMFATQWLLTQFTSSFRFDLVTRLWDCFLFEGWKVTYRIMLALLQHSQTALLNMGFEEILAYFRELPDRPEVDGSIVDLAMKIPLKTSHIRKYEKEWHLEQSQLQTSSSG